MSLNRILKTLVRSPASVFFLIVGLTVSMISIRNYWEEEFKDWRKTVGRLENIELHSRIRDRIPENFFRVTFGYEVEGKAYHRYEDKSYVTTLDIEKQKLAMQESMSTIVLYYNKDDPWESVMSEEETQPENSIWVVTTLVMMVIAALGFWSLYIRFHYMFRE